MTIGNTTKPRAAAARLGRLLADAAALIAVAAGVAWQRLPGADGPAESVLFEEMPVVEAASLHMQSLHEAPATVSIITAQDIRVYGYRTLAEALSNVRGFYTTDDYVYQYAGLRGFSLPGDYTSRIMVMLNGHYLNDNVTGNSMHLGQDFGLDMDLVERIEVIRGPSSALYGSSGLFATVNVVTKSPVDHPLFRSNAELGSLGDKKLQLSSAAYLGKGANLLLSASVFSSPGRDLYFAGLDNPATNNGVAEDVARDHGQHAFASILWRDWTFTVMQSNREVHLPHGVYNTVFNDSGNKLEEGRSFAEALYSRDLGEGSQLQWRFYYDSYRLWGRFDFDLLSDGTIWDTRRVALGDLAGSRLSYSRPLTTRNTLTAGSEINFDIRMLGFSEVVFPVPIEQVRVDRPDRRYGVFAQLERKLSARWTGYFGARLDGSANYGHFVSPRTALIYQHSPRTTVKLLYGRAFRNPNAYEAYWETPPYNIANPALDPEKMDTVEAAIERKLFRRLNADFSVFHYWMDDLIQAAPTRNHVVQYQNTAATRAGGAEFELHGRATEWLELGGSIAHNRVAESSFGLAMVNSPRNVGKFRFAMPVIQNRVNLSGVLRRLSERRTLRAGTVIPATLFDMTLTTERLHRNFELQFSARNLLNRRYYDPVGPEQLQDRMLQQGRGFFMKLIWRYEE